MKSVGESMAIGRTFKEAFQKGLRALETGRTGWVIGARPHRRPARRRRRSRRCAAALRTPTPERIFQIKRALLARRVASTRSPSAPAIDPWFLDADARSWSRRSASTRRSPRSTREARCARMKRLGFSDAQLGALRGETERRRARAPLGARHPPRLQDGRHLRRRVSLEHAVPLLARYDEENEAPRSGDASRSSSSAAGPNRIGQGVEFDYCCVRAALAFRELGYRDDHGQLESRDGLHRLRHLATRCTSSRSRSRTCSRSSSASSRSAWSCSSAARRRSS